MLMVDGRFKTAVVAAGDGMMRICTGNLIDSGALTEDDFEAHSKEEPADTLPIYSRRDVWKLVKTRVIASWVLALACFAGICFSTYSAYCNEALRGSPYQFSWHYVGIAALVLLFLSCFHQGIHPVVHDTSDHWVDLRNGSSNLCGGIVVRKKARWV